MHVWDCGEHANTDRPSVRPYHTVQPSVNYWRLNVVMLVGPQGCKPLTSKQSDVTFHICISKTSFSAPLGTSPWFLDITIASWSRRRAGVTLFFEKWQRRTFSSAFFLSFSSFLSLFLSFPYHLLAPCSSVYFLPHVPWRACDFIITP